MGRAEAPALGYYNGKRDTVVLRGQSVCAAELVRF